MKSPGQGGFLADRLGRRKTLVLFGLVAWFALPAGLRGIRADNSLRETWHVVRADRRFRQVLGSTLAVALVFVRLFTTMSLEIARSGFSASVYGLVISLNGLLVVCCELPLTTLTKRYPARSMMALGFLLISAGFASNALVRTLPLLVLTVALFALGEMASMPVAPAWRTWRRGAASTWAPAGWWGRWPSSAAPAWA